MPRVPAILALAILASTIAGCGYTTHSLIGDDFHTIQVEILGNKTFRRDLEFELTRDIQDEVLSRTNLRIVDRGRADVRLEGDIIDVTEIVLSTNSMDQVTESSVRITVRFRLVDQRTGEEIRHFTLYDSSAFLAETGQTQEGAVTIAVTARRDQIADLRKTLVDAVNDLAGRVLVVVPAIIRNYLLKLVAEAADSSSDKLASLLDASAVSIISVTYHGAPEPLGTVPSSSGPKRSSDYCALFIDFANWSLSHLEAITAEAGEPTFAVRDAFFTEYLVRMAAMQKVEPLELHDALATFAKYAQLYLAHDMSAILTQAKAMAPAGALINGHGKSVCGYEPQVTTSG